MKKTTDQQYFYIARSV